MNSHPPVIDSANAAPVTSLANSAPIFTGPLFSVLIGKVSTEDGMRIRETLDALRKQDPALSCEVLVVDRLHDDVTAAIRRDFPEVKLIDCENGTTLPAMRAMALGASRGKFIVVTEDHCVPPLSWLRDFKTVIDQHPGASVIGGCVENGVTGRVFDWATFLCEYGAFAPPIAEGATRSLAGMNVCYDRRVLDECPPKLLTTGFWETTVHPFLTGQGRLLFATNRIRILHCKRFSFRLFAAQRYAYARYYAGIRFPQDRHLTRWLAAVATPVLPMLLMLRLLRAAWRKASIAKPSLLAIPYLFVFFVITAIGELVGYLNGPGSSLKAIE